MVSALDYKSNGPRRRTSQGTALCSRARHFTLTVPTSTQVYKYRYWGLVGATWQNSGEYLVLCSFRAWLTFKRWNSLSLPYFFLPLSHAWWQQWSSCLSPFYFPKVAVSTPCRLSKFTLTGPQKISRHLCQLNMFIKIRDCLLARWNSIPGRYTVYQTFKAFLLHYQMLRMY